MRFRFVEKGEASFLEIETRTKVFRVPVSEVRDRER